MTQSDSPDFEFDISDLEVEREENAPSMEGTSVPDENAGEASVETGQVAGDQSVESDIGAGFDAADRELDVFEIDDLPSSLGEDDAVENQLGESLGGAEIASENREEDPVGTSEPEPQAVQRIDEKAEQQVSRVLGADDLGADVFAEIESDLGASMGLDDVIDDLMDEVEDFEAGGFVELDEEDTVSAPPSDDIFKMEDPDDSLRNAVDPNAEDEEPLAAAPSFPSPPSDFEIPADPEPDPVEVAEQPDAAILKEESVPLEKAPPAKAAAAASPDLSQFEIPADPEPVVEAAESIAKEAEAKPSPLVDAPAPTSSVAVEEPVFEEPQQDEPPLAETSEEVEAPPAAAVEGRETILFSAEDEESPEIPADEGEEEDVSDLLASILEQEAEEELVSEAISEDENEVEDSAIETEEVEAEETEASAPEAVESQLEEESEEASEQEEEDLSDLLDAISEDVDEEEPVASASPESMEDAIPGLVEVAEEEDDLRDSASEEDSAEASVSEIPGLVEIEDVPGLQEVSDEPEAEAAAFSMPSLVEVDEELDEEDISSLIDSAGAGESSADEASGPSLGVIEDDDEDEIVAMPVPDIPGLVEVSDEEDVPGTAPAVATATPTAEELLMRAGSLLNGNSEKPADGASALLDIIDDDDEEIVSMPSPEAMIADAAGSEDEVVTLPDPASLMTTDGEAVAVIDDDDEDIPAPGNVADRGGNLPPPPPAPVEIIDEEPPEEDTQPDVPSVEVESGLEPFAMEDDVGLEDPFSSDISLDDFDEDLSSLGELGDASEEVKAAEESVEEAVVLEKEAAAAVVVEMPKPSLLWRITHSMAIAAGLALIGLASVLAVWKQQIVEYYEGRDIDGSALILQIEEIGRHALGEFDENGLYHMEWLDSEVRRVSENEIRLHAVVGAQLRENLYRPVLESRLDSRGGYSEGQMLETLGYARDYFPEEIGNYPVRPWDRLYELSAKKEDVLPLRVTYGLQRANKESDWALANIKVSGYKGDLEWPEGEPKYAFGENAYDINSPEFVKLYSNYKAASEEFVARVDRLRSRIEDGALELKRENDQQRERVKMALAEGSFFNGLVIVGEDATESRDVQLVITEVRNDGDFVKGVVKMAGEKPGRSKQFVGSLEFETTMSGREQGYLSLKTVSLDAPASYVAESPFFEPDNVSRMRLKADGFRLEGDSRDVSFRLTRSL